MGNSATEHHTTGLLLFLLPFLPFLLLAAWHGLPELIAVNERTRLIAVKEATSVSYFHAIRDAIDVEAAGNFCFSARALWSDLHTH